MFIMQGESGGVKNGWPRNTEREWKWTLSQGTGALDRGGEEAMDDIQELDRSHQSHGTN